MAKHHHTSDPFAVPSDLPHAALLYRPGDLGTPMAQGIVSEVERRLGGSKILEQLGAGAMVFDETHVSFTLSRANPRHVRSVVIVVEPGGDFRMDCNGARPPGCLTSPLLASACLIVPENLATVLDQLTGLETIHHHHF